MKKIVHVLYITITLCLLICVGILMNNISRLSADMNDKANQIAHLKDMEHQLKQQILKANVEIADLHSTLDKDASEIANLQKNNKQLRETITIQHSDIKELKAIPLNAITIDSHLDPQVVFQVLKYFKAIEENDADAFLATTLGTDPNDFYLWEIHIKENRSFQLSSIALANQVNENLIEIHVGFHNPENLQGVYTQAAMLAAMKKDGVWWLHDGS